MPGGGVNALRGESNVQGSTDFGLLYDNVPGYLNAPTATNRDATYESFLEKELHQKQVIEVNKPKFFDKHIEIFLW